MKGARKRAPHARSHALGVRDCKTVSGPGRRYREAGLQKLRLRGMADGLYAFRKELPALGREGIPVHFL
jgi:hypothetical protein